MPVQLRSTGYGRAALDMLREVVATAKRDDAMAPVTILVPNNIAGIVARRHLAHGLTDDHPGVAGIYLATLPRLAEQIAAPHLDPRRPATRPILASAWRSTLDAAPGLFASASEHPATIRALTNAHRELRDLTEPALQAVAAAGKLPGDVARLHNTVTDKLRQDWYDPTDLLHTATHLVNETPETIRELGAVVLYLPQALTQAEAAFAHALSDHADHANHADLTVLVGLTGVRRADTAVRRTLTRLGLGQPEDSPKPPTATQVRHASDSDDEVRCIIREVVTTFEQTPAHRIAILYGRPSPYARLLHEQLNQAGITFNGPGTRAVHERALARGFLGILGLAQTAMPRAELFRALAEAPAKTFDDGRV
nr:PD-(D/E)XK nuclease family protein [Nocardioidaceae bacterium]